MPTIKFENEPARTLDFNPNHSATNGQFSHGSGSVGGKGVPVGGGVHRGANGSSVSVGSQVEFVGPSGSMVKGKLTKVETTRTGERHGIIEQGNGLGASATMREIYPSKGASSGKSLAEQANANQLKSLSTAERHALSAATAYNNRITTNRLKTGNKVSIQETSQVLASKGIKMEHGSTAPDASGRWVTTYKLTHPNGKVEMVEATALRSRLQGKAPKAAKASAASAMTPERRAELLAKVKAKGQMPGAPA